MGFFFIEASVPKKKKVEKFGVDAKLGKGRLEIEEKKIGFGFVAFLGEESALVSKSSLVDTL